VTKRILVLGRRRERTVASPGRAAAVVAGLVFALVSLAAGQAHAWDPATTHAGLTARAVASSKLHMVLANRLGRGLGTFEPLKLDASAIDADEARSLQRRLDALDPAGGYRPNHDGLATAMAWTNAGAVLAKTPPELGRNHFFEPRSRTGLDDDDGLAGTFHALRLTLGDGATVRDAATGQVFALSGMSALDWLLSPDNDLGLPVFFAQWELAATAARPNARETALVRALLALGGVLAVLEDAGQPAFVRNDFRGEFLGRPDGSALERFVAEHYGQVALPVGAPAISRATWQGYFVAADGKGLAQATQRRFFSAGTLPRDIPCDDETTGDVVALANQSLRFPEPRLSSLDLRRGSETRYVVQDGARILAYQRGVDSVRFFEDHAVFADIASHWLPRIEGYAAGFINHLLRARTTIAIEGKKASLTVSGASLPLTADTSLRVLSEAADGERREIASLPLQPGQPMVVDIPPGARRIVAVVHGHDAAGELVAVDEATTPP
jgi:hypothetical protein